MNALWHALRAFQARLGTSQRLLSAGRHLRKFELGDSALCLRRYIYNATSRKALPTVTDAAAALLTGIPLSLIVNLP